MKATRLEAHDEPVRVLYFGQYGTGKTSHAATMANLGPTIYANLESGIKRKALDRLGGIDSDNLRIVKPDSYRDLERLFWKLNRSENPPVGFVLDSATDFQHKTMVEVVEKRIEKKKAKGWDDNDPFMRTKDDWGRGNEMVRRLIRYYRDLPIHVALTALERLEVVEDEDGREVGLRYVPAITPGLQSDIGGYMDIVCYCRVKEVGGVDEYQGIFRPGERWTAKDRFNVLPKMLVNPTFERIVGYVEGTLTLDNDETMAEARARRPKRKGR